MESPPPRFSEGGRFSESGSPRFTEHFNASPPYQQYISHDFDGENAPIPHYGDTGMPMSHRLSNKDRPLSPDPTEISSPIPESYRPDDEEKEVALPPIQPDQRAQSTSQEPQRRRICGLPLLWVIVLAGLIVALAIGLGVGLGVGLTNDGSSSSNDNASDQNQTVNADYSIGGGISPAYYSTEGAFNGSGIALASQSFARELSDGTQGTLVMYFQHHTGEIRYKQLSSQGEWRGGDISAVVASDAKNSTPLSAVSYVSQGVSTWHVFYIDQNNTIRQRTNSNASNVWDDGPINDMDIQVYDADLVGMQACWYGNDYGDSDYAHTPLPNEDPKANASHEVGMHMWYASDATTFQQLGWREGDDTWTHQANFTGKNGHAGVGCYSWGPGTVTYVMMVNDQNTVEFYWKDTNTNMSSTKAHPINQWVNSSISIPNVHPSTSLGYTNAFYAQDASTLLFNGYNISWAAENTSFITEDQFTVQGEPGLPGTHLSVSAIPNQSGGNDLVVFYQTNGSDVSEYTRDLVAGQWTSVEIDIPS